MNLDILIKDIKKDILYKNDLVDILIYTIFRKYEYKEISSEVFTNLLYEVCSLYNRDLKFLFDRYKWLQMMNLDPNIQLEKNHHIIYEIFDKFNIMMNENNIEGYYTSGILAYTLINEPLERYHHDLDIFINMEDLNKLETICEKYNFTFLRKIGDRGDGTNRRVLKVYYEDYLDIPITVFMYVREKDGSITQKDYFFNKNKELLIENIYNSKKCVELSFDNNKYYHNGIAYKSISLEALYLSKVGNRPKDIYDCKKIKPHINNVKLTELNRALVENMKNDIISAEDDKYKEFILAQNKSYSRRLEI